MGQEVSQPKPEKTNKRKPAGVVAPRPVLRSLSDIYGFFRTNTTPVYFVSPAQVSFLVPLAVTP